MRTRGFVSLALLALLGCTERIQEGGFETSDLQAHVQRPDGSPVAAARVWLVRSLGDAAPAVVIDSTLTDTAGRARFLYDKGADLSLIGLDAQSGDSLGLAPSAFAKGTVASIALQETKSVQIGRDSTGALLALHVPGSHFGSRRSANGEASVLALPKGAWDVAFVAGTRVQVVRGLAVRADTVLAGVAGVKAVATDTITKVSDTLHDGPDIALDSFRVDGVTQYVDTSLPPAWAWASSGSGDGSPWRSEASFIEEDTGWTTLSSRPFFLIRDSATHDTAFFQGFAEVVTPALPAKGTLALQFAFPTQLAADTNLVRRIQLVDTLGHGVEVFLQRPTRLLDSIGLSDRLSSMSLRRIQTDTTAILGAGTWYFSWASESIVVRNTQGLVGTAQVQGGSFSSLRFYLLVRTKVAYGNTAATIQRTRLYTPK